MSTSPDSTTKTRVVVLFNTDWEDRTDDPENQSRKDVAHVAVEVAQVLRERGFDATELGLGDRIATVVSRLAELAPDIVFNLCESLAGLSLGEATIARMLSDARLSFTGSTGDALSIACQKRLAKDAIAAAGLPTPAYALVLNAADTVDVPFPVIVKPSREDASVGIDAGSVVNDVDALRARVRLIIERYQQPALVERFIDGREVYVPLLARPDGVLDVLPLDEIDFALMPADRPRIVTHDGKWAEGSVDWQGSKPIPARLDAAQAEHLGDLARRAFAALGLRDYGRVDIRLAPDGSPFVIDVNPNCDLSSSAGFARAARAAGLAYGDVIERIARLALARVPQMDRGGRG